MFKLTKEQVNYLVEYYGLDLFIIKDIERRVNLLGVVEDIDDYFEIVKSTVSKKKTIIDQMKKCYASGINFSNWLTTKQLVEYTIAEKFNNKSERQTKTRNFC